MTQEPEPKEKKENTRETPLNEQITGIVLKVFNEAKPEKVLPATVVAALLALIRGNVITASWIAVIGLIISFVLPIAKEPGEALQKKLEKFGKAIARAIGYDDTFENTYLEHLEDECLRHTQIPFILNENASQLRSDLVFVQLQLSLDAPSEKEENNQQDIPEVPLAPSSKPLTIWEFLAQKSKNSRRIIILARGGSGKTTLLKHVALIYAQKKHRQHRTPKRIPFLLHLNDWRQEFSQPSIPSLLELIQTYIVDKLLVDTLEMPSNWVEDLLKSGRALVMLDGLDEISDAQKRTIVAQWVDREMKRYSKSVFILTSRRRAYQEGYPIQMRHQQLWITGFEPDQQQEFITKICFERARRSPESELTHEEKQRAKERAKDLQEKIHERRLQKIARNPLLLNMIIQIYFSSDQTLPVQRVGLYQEFCEQLLRSRPFDPLSEQEQLLLLQNLAVAMVWDNQSTIQRRQAIAELASQSVVQERNINPERFLNHIVDVGLLVHSENAEYNYEFALPSFQGHLAARQMRSPQQFHLLLDQSEENLLNLLKEEWWKETILFYAATNPNHRIQVLGELSNLAQNTSNPDIAKDITTLVSECEQESSRGSDADLEEEVCPIRYRDLRAYLVDQQWKMAEEETYRRMIQVVGKEEGPWFSRDDLLNFPPADLLLIDRLWVQYSNGRFGFSVQRKIYLECGGKPDGEHYKEAWEEFGDRVGWRKQDGTLKKVWRKIGDFRGRNQDEDWIDYDDLIFNLNAAPKGHLPLYPPAQWASMRRQGGALFSNSAWERLEH